MDSLQSLRIIELRHQELRADADRARRPVGARQAPRSRTFIAWVQSLSRAAVRSRARSWPDGAR